MPDAPASTPAPAPAAPVQQATTSTTPAPAATPAPNAGTQPTTTPSTTTAPAAGGEVKPGEKPAETKPAETKAEQPAAIELKLPKDSLLSAVHVQELADFAKANGIKPEIAQQMLENQSKAVAAHQAKMVQDHIADVQKWDKELTDDPEIGGEKIQANMDLGRRALEKFGSKELIETLRSTGYNSFPPLVKLLVNIGKAMGEDRIATGGESVKSDLRSLYKSMPNP